MNLLFEQIESSSPNVIWLDKIENMSDLKPNPSIKSWLTETRLLTHRIKKSGYKHTIRVLREELGATPTLLKNKHQSEINYIREIMLSINNDACLLAQALVPKVTLDTHHWIKSLGDQPLGEKLSTLPKVSRSVFEYACLELSGVSVWARRSSFEIDSTFLWVAELFLPAIGGFKNLDK